MPPAFARDKIADMMSLLSSYDVTMVIPNNPAFHGPELPHYLLSACELLLVYESYNGLKAHQHARLYDFGNGTSVGTHPLSVPSMTCSLFDFQHGERERNQTAQTTSVGRGRHLKLHSHIMGVTNVRRSQPWQAIYGASVLW